MAANRIDYLVLKKSRVAGPNDYSDCPRSPFCAQAFAAAEPVFENADYQVLRLNAPER